MTTSDPTTETTTTTTTTVESATDTATADLSLAEAVADIRRIVRPRSGKPPIILRRCGPVTDIIQGPTCDPWRPREMATADKYGFHLIGGDLHDTIDPGKRRIRPTELKGLTPQHSDRTRVGCILLRARQHEFLCNVPIETQRNLGYTPTGDYVLSVYDRFDDPDDDEEGIVIVLDDHRIGARDLDRIAQPNFYERRDSQDESSVEWTDVPVFNPDVMHARLDRAAVRLRALGHDPAEYRDELARIHHDIDEAVEDST